MLIGFLHRVVRLRLRILGLRSSWISLPNCRVHLYSYYHPSATDTLVLLHGVGTSSSTWLYLYPLMIQKYSVVAIDLPGFGFSTVEDEKGFLTLPEHLAVVEQCIEQLNLPHCTLFGHSLGGWIASLYALRNSERTTSLVLINPAGIYTDGVEELRNLFAVQSTADVRRLMERMWYRYPWYFKPFFPAIKKELIRRKVPQLIQSIMREDFLNDRLQKLSMPVHLIWGVNDRLLNEQTVRVFGQTVQRLGVVYIRECGHVPQLEKPKELVKHLRRILQVDNGEKPISRHLLPSRLLKESFSVILKERSG